jgi:hypothetical protein
VIKDEYIELNSRIMRGFPGDLTLGVVRPRKPIRRNENPVQLKKDPVQLKETYSELAQPTPVVQLTK